MYIDAKDLTPPEAYKLLVGSVVPRPIAWVTTLSSAGKVNVAPFSCFTFVSYSPPMLAISVGRKGDVLKDTSRHIAERQEFVINIANFELLNHLHQTSAEYPEDVSEAEALGLETVPSQQISVPRLLNAPIGMECRLERVVEFGALRTELIVGEVLAFHFRENVYVNGKIDTLNLSPIARLGGPRYMKVGDVVSVDPIPASFG